MTQDEKDIKMQEAIKKHIIRTTLYNAWETDFVETCNGYKLFHVVGVNFYCDPHYEARLYIEPDGDDVWIWKKKPDGVELMANCSLKPYTKAENLTRVIVKTVLLMNRETEENSYGLWAVD